MCLSKKIIRWYKINKRNLPWRDTSDPYRIWLSEIILQQTRVSQGLGYYERFVEKYPNVHSLARASEDEVLLLWQGLGYYSRGRNLHHTARYISINLNGQFPDNFEGLRKLKGIGDYTAAAIASFAFKECVPVVDGNVYRVLSRYMAIDEPINSPAAKKIFFNKAMQLIDRTQPDIFNQAIMEFGALNCVPKNPKCNECVLKSECCAFLRNCVTEFPVKTKKVKIKNREFTYFVVKHENNVLIEKRTNNDIWRNLYQFPLEEIHYDGDDYLRKSKLLQQLVPDGSVRKSQRHKPVMHKLTHQHLSVIFVEIEAANVVPYNFEKVTLECLKQYSFPKVIVNFLSKLK